MSCTSRLSRLIHFTHYCDQVKDPAYRGDLQSKDQIAENLIPVSFRYKICGYVSPLQATGSCIIASWHSLFKLMPTGQSWEVVFLFALIASGGYVYLLLTFSF
jgi:hypothetical protein